MTDITAKPFDWNDNLSKEAIEDFEGIRKDLPYCTCQSIGMALAKLELLEKQGQELKTGWIPVSERLPKPFSYVNCTCHSLIDDREDWVVETCYVPQPSNSPYSDWGNIPMLNKGDCEVVAWVYREIPKPYKAESEIHCTWTDSEIAKSFIEDVEAVKDLLPRAEGSDKE